ncbi:MAG TPA: response regulator [Chroococcales cyanobacterium]|jgi:CheY-like chemotaxis protein
MEKSSKILLVDDDADLIEINRTILEGEGYQVLFAYDIEEAFALAKREKPDLVLLDIMMDRKNDGFTFCYRLKGDPELSGIPVLMLSSVAQATGFRLSLDSDREWMKADDFLNKPVSSAVLLDHVERLLKGTVR